MFHYGWARPVRALREKRELGRIMYPWRNADPTQPLISWMPGLRRFEGTHPKVALQWIEARQFDPERVLGAPRFRWEFVRFYISGVIEQLTGVRVFEFRNYKIV
jgi:hypothetical protein